jgi:Holliday junction resolvase-like predicted endonuclease
MDTVAFTSRHVGVAAEAVAAALFARCGLDISVQYGANQPEYDLIVAKSEKMLKVSVKGSKDGRWGLTQSYLKNADYQGAIRAWLDRHKLKTIFCFVQYKDVGVDAMPRVYLATPAEVADCLRLAANGRGDTILHEHHTWGARATGAGSVDKLPEHWQFCLARVEQLLSSA